MKIILWTEIIIALFYNITLVAILGKNKNLSCKQEKQAVTAVRIGIALLAIAVMAYMGIMVMS